MWIYYSVSTEDEWRRSNTNDRFSSLVVSLSVMFFKQKQKDIKLRFWAVQRCCISCKEYNENISIGYRLFSTNPRVWSLVLHLFIYNLGIIQVPSKIRTPFKYLYIQGHSITVVFDYYSVGCRNKVHWSLI